MASWPVGQVSDGGEHWAAMALNWSIPLSPPLHLERHAPRAVRGRAGRWPSSRSCRWPATGPSWYVVVGCPSSSSSARITVASGRSSARGVSSKSERLARPRSCVVVAPSAPRWSWSAVAAVVVVVVVSGTAVVVVEPSGGRGRRAHRRRGRRGAPSAAVVVVGGRGQPRRSRRAPGGPGRKRSSAVAPTTSRARCWFFTPGSCTTTELPCRVISGSATPRASTRLRMISIVCVEGLVARLLGGLEDHGHAALEVEAELRGGVRDAARPRGRRRRARTMKMRGVSFLRRMGWGPGRPVEGSAGAPEEVSHTPRRFANAPPRASPPRPPPAPRRPGAGSTTRCGA